MADTLPRLSVVIPLYKEEDKLHEQLLEKFDINVMSKRQEWNKKCEEEDAKEGNND